MPDGNITTIGTCYLCKRTFAYKPGEVFTVTLDAGTNMPPGMTALGTFQEAPAEASARTMDRVVCPGCVDRAKQVQETGDMSAWARPRKPRR